MIGVGVLASSQASGGSTAALSVASYLGGGSSSWNVTDVVLEAGDLVVAFVWTGDYSGSAPTAVDTTGLDNWTLLAGETYRDAFTDGWSRLYWARCVTPGTYSLPFTGVNSYTGSTSRVLRFRGDLPTSGSPFDSAPAFGLSGTTSEFTIAAKACTAKSWVVSFMAPASDGGHEWSLPSYVLDGSRDYALLDGSTGTYAGHLSWEPVEAGMSSTAIPVDRAPVSLPQLRLFDLPLVRT